jgi:hypothetical protein
MPPGRRRPGLADAVDLIWGGVRTRVRLHGSAIDTRSAWQYALAIYSVAGPALILFAAVLLAIQDQLVQYMINAQEHLVSPGLGPSAWALITAMGARAALPGALLAAVLLRWRRAGVVLAATGASWYSVGLVYSRSPGVFTGGYALGVAASCGYLLAAAALVAANPDQARRLLRRRHLMVPAAALLAVQVSVVATVFMPAPAFRLPSADVVGVPAVTFVTAAPAAGARAATFISAAAAGCRPPVAEPGGGTSGHGPGCALRPDGPAAQRLARAAWNGWMPISVPWVNCPCPIGIGHQASARTSLLVAPAPRPQGVASAWPPAAEATDTATQSSTSGEDAQSHASRARSQGRLAGRVPCSAASSGTANSSKITAAASG